MPSLKPFIKAAFALSTLITAASATTYDIAGYWGQGGDAEGSLHDYCANSKSDIVILSVVSTFGSGGPLSDINLSSHCGSPCLTVGQDIQACQNMGKKVLVSLGGATSTYGLTSDAEATALAQDLFNEYLSGQGTFFGSGVAVDGIDFDIELDAAGAAYYPVVANTLRSLDSKTIILSASPQCPHPDSNVNDLLTQADIDYAFIQYYNNPSCAVGSEGFNFDTWNSASYLNSNIKLYLGLYSSPEISGSGYVSSYSTLKSTIDSLKGYSRFGGVSFWTGHYGLANDDLLNEPYETVVYDLLNPPVSSTTSSSTSTSAALSTSASTAAATTTSSTTISSTSASSTSASSTSTSSTSTSSTSTSSTSTSSTSTISTSTSSPSSISVSSIAWTNSTTSAATIFSTNTASSIASTVSAASITEGATSASTVESGVTASISGSTFDSSSSSATVAEVSADPSSIVTVVDGVTITMPCPCEETKKSLVYTHSHSHSAGVVPIISVSAIAPAGETGAYLNAESASAGETGETGSIVTITAIPTETVTTECSSEAVSTAVASIEIVTTVPTDTITTECTSEAVTTEAVSATATYSENLSSETATTEAVSVETTEITMTYSTETVEVTEIITVEVSSATHSASVPVASASVTSSVPVVGAASYTSFSILSLVTIAFSVILCL